MKTQEFITALQQNQDVPLSFVFESGQSLATGYHITEVKNIHVEAVDCGGASDVWDDTVIQLWLPATIDPSHHMPGSKALKILSNANKIRPMNLEANCRFEVEEEAGTAIIYTPVRIENVSGTLTIALASQKTQCKANDRADAQELSGGCSPSETSPRCC